MSYKTKFFISLVIAVGWVELIRNLLAWRADDLTGFLVYFVIAILLSGLKLRLPGVTGTISVCFLFVLIGIVSLNLPQVLLTGCSAVLVQYFWHSSKKLRLVQGLFNIGSAAFAISASYHVFHSVWLRSLPLEQAVLLAVLACTYFVTTTILVAAVIAFTEGKSIRGVWRTSYLWALPYYLLGAATAGIFEVAQRRLGWQTSMLVIPATYVVYRSYRLYLDRLEDKRKHAEETAALHLRTIESLALAIEAKDHTTHDHLQRVQVYAVEIGKDLRLSDTELQAIRAASVLHDIGKIAVPEHIICKPGKLTPEEFGKMKIHPVVGAEILARAQFPYPVVPIVRSHHEKWDGSGYPDGLKGEEIPIGARILSAVDCLDALASDRQYRRALPLGKAMEMVVEQSGKAFDPAVVELLQKRYVELEQLARSSQMETFSLSTDINVERGAAPDAGFEEAADHAPLHAAPSSASANADWATLVELIQGLTGILSRHEVLSILAGRLQEILPCDCLAFYARHDSTLIPEYAAGTHIETLSRLKVPMGHGLSGWVAANGRSILNGNPSVDSSSLIGLRSALAIPLEGEDDVAGVLTLFRAKPDAFSALDLLELSALGDALGDLMESAAARPVPRQNVIAMAPQPVPRARTIARSLQPV
ncbi:MAG TPA: HD domain-containing phosphohydrolase [Bryobacteraceae bacterium]|nr:HD domain-containing phosphohydrolase [Bryobacteraceae bacterium]